MEAIKRTRFPQKHQIHHTETATLYSEHHSCEHHSCRSLSSIYSPSNFSIYSKTPLYPQLFHQNASLHYPPCRLFFHLSFLLPPIRPTPLRPRPNLRQGPQRQQHATGSSLSALGPAERSRMPERLRRQQCMPVLPLRHGRQ